MILFTTTDRSAHPSIHPLWNTESDVILSVGKSLFYVDTFSVKLLKGHRYILSVIIGH